MEEQNNLNTEHHFEQEEAVLQIKHALDENNKQEFLEKFLENHPFEQMQIFLELTEEEQRLINDMLTPAQFAEFLNMIESDEVNISQYLKQMPEDLVGKILGEMYTDNAVDVLRELTIKEAKQYVNRIPAEARDEVKRLFYYDEETAGGIMTTEFIALNESQSVKEALYWIKHFAQEAETIYYIYVVDQLDHLVGVLSLRDLIIYPDEALLKDLMETRLISVSIETDQLKAAQIIQDYDLLALPVVDLDNELVGIITVDDVLDVLEEEASSDYSGLAGVDVDIPNLTPLKAALKRLPWLITLLFLGMGTSTLISQYESLIAEASILSVFVTLITGTAGNAGTQSLAVSVRELSLTDDHKQTFLKTLIRELTTGLITGIVTGLTIMLVVGIWRGNFALGAIIGLAMLAAITVATLAGSFIPQLMEKIGVDPAVASGPFISTLSDLTSVLIYFSIASYFLSSFV
ncbi:magnesium transporter [Atopobacter phocae]|uniref:magnesium transporter n=1 Tax=Atopobacter phocae TaxID=136492 RepID=UPI00046EB63F|nr:magnesium transporter [Atopobacter phocae]